MSTRDTSGYANLPVAGEILHKFGGTAAIGTAVSDVWTTGGVYAWPTASFLVEVVSASANDAAAGTGARSIIVEGLDASGLEASEEIATNGTTAVAGTQVFSRVNRAYVVDAGTYGTTTAGGNAGTITIRTVSAGQTHAQILVTSSAAMGQTQVARYSVPTNRVCMIFGWTIHVDSTKSVDINFMHRRSFLTVAAPFTSPRLMYRAVGVSGALAVRTRNPLEVPGGSDIWWTGIVSASTASVTIDWEALIRP